MSTSRILTYLLTLLVGGGIGFVIGNTTKKEPAAQASQTRDLSGQKKAVENSDSADSIDAPDASLLAEETGSEEQAPETPTKPAATEKEKPKQEASQTDEPKVDEKPAVKPVNPAIPVVNPGNLPTSTLCYKDDAELSLALTLKSERMEKDSLMYDSKNPSRLQDCSGIFHQLTQFVASTCTQYDYPTPKKARDSRSIARWFHEKGNLLIIEDPEASRNLIRPGSVMFFGRSGQRYKDMNIDLIAGINPRGVITHIGMVTEVKKDENGDVIGYVMMHGRRQGVTAQRSHYHNIKPPRLGYPVLGNWNQQWVAIAYSMTPKQ